jgi:putative Holliday junction resolvase
MRVLALDLGERRIGVALSDPLGVLATPLTVLKLSSREDQLAAIEKLVQRHQVERIIVGYPRSLNGHTGPQAQRVDRYVAQLSARLETLDSASGVPIVLWDERFSTVHAERLLHEAGKRVRREHIDAAAAAVILQSYLDAQPDASQGGTI